MFHVEQFLTFLAGFCIGMFKESIYKTQELAFNKGDQILIYTDGVTEQTNEIDDYFGEEPLNDILSKNINSTAADINQRIIQSVYQFSNKKQLQDDLTLVMIKKTA